MPDHDEVGLGVAAVARRLGVATGTLRTWDRRYGLGPSAHRAGSRRHYTATDLARLRLMRRLMVQGVSAADAARAAVDSPAPAEEDLEPVFPDLGTSGQAPGAGTSSGAPRRSRTGGGRVLATRKAGPAARGLARAAMSLDSDSCTSLLAASVARVGVLDTWTEVLLPVLAGIEERCRTTGAGREIEHLLSESAETALRAAGEDRAPAINERPVLVAALEPEVRRLPLVVLGAALAEHRVGARPLGAGLPVRALGDAVVRTGALAVVLWSQGEQGPTGFDGQTVAAVRPRPEVVLAGPGWAEPASRPGILGITVVGDLTQAVEAVVAIAGVGLGSARR